LDKEGKKQVVSHLSQKLKQATFAVLTNYRGLNVEKITKLRNELRSVSSDYKVAKNTFLKRASEGTELEQLNEYFVGPTAILLSYDDPIAPSKILAKFLKNYSELQVKAGFLQGRVLSVEEIKGLSTLPGREALLSRIVSLCVMPQMRLLNTLNRVPQKFVQILRAIEKEKSDK
jgi:large subunit ribosomal protein L10